MMVLPLLVALVSAPSPSWTGADEKIVERIAEERGHPANPLLPTGEGDLQLAAFLLAGTAGGFLLGWLSKTLFGRPTPPSTKHESRPLP